MKYPVLYTPSWAYRITSRSGNNEPKWVPNRVSKNEKNSEFTTFSVSQKWGISTGLFSISLKSGFITNPGNKNTGLSTTSRSPSTITGIRWRFRIAKMGNFMEKWPKSRKKSRISRKSDQKVEKSREFHENWPKNVAKWGKWGQMRPNGTQWGHNGTQWGPQWGYSGVTVGMEEPGPIPRGHTRWRTVPVPPLPRVPPHHRVPMPPRGAAGYALSAGSPGSFRLQSIL